MQPTAYSAAPNADDPLGGGHGDDGDDGERPAQRSEAERELPTLREHQHRRADRSHGQTGDAEQSRAPGVQRPGGEGEGEQDPGNGARRGGQERQRHPEHEPSSAEGGDRRQPDGEAKGKGQPTDRHVDDGASSEQHAGRCRPAVPARQGLERGGRGDAADDRHQWCPERRAEHREEDPVAGRVVAGEPQVVPDRRTVPINELESQQLGRPVGTAPAEGEGEEGEDGGRCGRGGGGARAWVDWTHQPTTVVVPTYTLASSPTVPRTSAVSTRDVRSLQAPAAASTLLVGRKATPSSPRRVITR